MSRAIVFALAVGSLCLVTVAALSRAQGPAATVGPDAAIVGEPDGPALTLHAEAAAPVNCDVSAKELAADAWELEVLQRTNDYRAQAGLPALRWDSTASRAAAWKAREIPGQYSRTGVLSHDDDRPTRTFAARMRDCAVSGYPTVGENIAVGYGSPEDVVNAWIGSSSHAQNMRRTWGSMAVGYADGAGWVQVFSGATGDGDTGGGIATPTATPTATATPTPVPTPTPRPSGCTAPDVGDWCLATFALPDSRLSVQRWTHTSVPGQWFVFLDSAGAQVGPFSYCPQDGPCRVLN